MTANDLPICCISLSHQNTPVDIRNRFAFSDAEAAAFRAALCGTGAPSGGACIIASAGIASADGAAPVAPASAAQAGTALCGTGAPSGVSCVIASAGVPSADGAAPVASASAPSAGVAFASGAVLVSTCNRTELYYTPAAWSAFGAGRSCGAPTRAAGVSSLARAQELLALCKRQDVHVLRKYCRSYLGADAVRHLFSVAAGLDSMVLGENQILGQLRQAYKAAFADGCTDFYLNTVFQRALSCAKRVKTETNLSKTTESIATLAVKAIMAFAAERGQGSAADAPDAATVLLIGASGQTGGVIVRELAERSGVRVFATVRRHHALPALPHVQHIGYDERYAYLDRADVVVSATASPHYTLSYDDAVRDLRTKKPRLFLDLAVPNDIEPDLANVAGVSVRNIDSFTKIAAEHNQQKRQGVVQAGDIVAEEVDAAVKELLFHRELDFIQDFGTQLQARTGMQLVYEMRRAATADELTVLLSLWHRMYAKTAASDAESSEQAAV